MLRRTFTCFFLIMAVGCAPGQQDADDASAAEVAIEVATESWIAAYEQGDVEMLVNLFEEDALYVANTGEVLRDRNGIRNGVRKWLAQRPAGVRLDLDVQPVRFRFRQ